MTTFSRLALVIQGKIAPCNWIERAFVTVVNSLKLPAVGTSDKGKYLKTNSETGNLEWASGAGGGGADPYTSTPAALGVASAGESDNYSRGDHVHAMPSASDVGAAPAVTEVTVATDGAVTQALDPGKIYHFTGALTALTITLTAAASGQIAQYHFDFDCGSAAPTVTIPNTVTMPDSQSFVASTHYEVDILNNYGAVLSWSIGGGGR